MNFTQTILHYPFYTRDGAEEMMTDDKVYAILRNLKKLSQETGVKITVAQTFFFIKLYEYALEQNPLIAHREDIHGEISGKIRTETTQKMQYMFDGGDELKGIKVNAFTSKSEANMGELFFVMSVTEMAETFDMSVAGVENGLKALSRAGAIKRVKSKNDPYRMGATPLTTILNPKVYED